jgi:hypothetical protein
MRSGSRSKSTSDSGQSRKWLRINGMTALPSRADIARPPRHVSFVSFAIFCTAEYGTLFNHPFGAGTAVIIRIQSPMYR